MNPAAIALPVLVGAFVVAGAAVWLAGVQLSNTTDAIDDRFGLGEALGGLLVLAFVTNLPEMAIVGAAAARHNFDIATGNILGGIGVQTLVLVALDGFGSPRTPLSFETNSLVAALEGTLVCAVLAIAVGATLLPAKVTFARLDAGSVLIAGVWIVGLLLIRRARNHLPWKATVQPSDVAGVQKSTRYRRGSNLTVFGVFGAAALVTLAGGVALEVTGDAIATDIHLNGVVFGGTFLAAATALPELSTGLQAVKIKDFGLAVSDIFGGNAFLPVLFLPATLLAGQSVLASAQKTDVLLACLGILLTTVYMFGLVLRPRRQFARLGADSIVVLALYVLGIVALVVVARA